MSNRRVRMLFCLVAPLLCGALAAIASAQNRADVIAQAQADKAAHAAPYQPGRAERLFARMEEDLWFVGVPRGLYPAVGSIYPGGGLGLGAGYRQFFGYSSFVGVTGLYSLAGYKRAEVTVSSTGHVRGRFGVDFIGGWLDATQIPYFGLGTGSGRDNRANFRLNHAYAEGTLVFRPVRHVVLRAGLGFDDYQEKSGRGRFPTIEQRFTTVTAPRLGEDPAYIRAIASGAVLWLNSPAYSRKGGLFRFAYDGLNPARGDGSAFGITSNELVQHVPILRETWVLSFRARAESIVGDAGTAPYFMLPWLGSGGTLRGYSTGRFRDRHSLLLTGEWRWFPNRLGLEMALFMDAGKVAGRMRDAFSVDDMKFDYGIGARFHAPAFTVLRIELARGDEGWRTIFAASAPF